MAATARALAADQQRTKSRCLSQLNVSITSRRGSNGESAGSGLTTNDRSVPISAERLNLVSPWQQRRERSASPLKCKVPPNARWCRQLSHSTTRTVSSRRGSTGESAAAAAAGRGSLWRLGYLMIKALSVSKIFFFFYHHLKRTCSREPPARKTKVQPPHVCVRGDFGFLGD